MNARRGRSFALCMLCFAVFIQSCSFQNKEPISEQPRAEAPTVAAPPAPEPIYLSVDHTYPLELVFKPKLVVFKGERKLLLVNDKVLIREYRIALGFNPKGDKRFKGDGRTPEGKYLICIKNGSSKYYKSLGLNYPDPQHAEVARETGCISTDQYDRILEANQCMLLPPGNTTLGGDIFIHGGGIENDWTLGCIALNNRDMDELFEVVSRGTPVVIMP